MEILYIKTLSGIAVSIKGKTPKSLLQSIDAQDKCSCICIQGDDIQELEILGEKKALDNDFGYITTVPLFYEQNDYEVVIEKLQNQNIVFKHENLNIQKSITNTGRENKLLSGHINFGSDIGYSDLILELENKEYLKIKIEVFPSKISYKTDYENLKKDIINEVYGLIFGVLSKTYQELEIGERKGTLIEFFAILNKIFFNYTKSIDFIISKPHHLLQSTEVVLPAHKIHSVKTRTIKWLDKHPEFGKKIEGNLTFEKALAVRKIVTYNTTENKFVKYIIFSTIKSLGYFIKKFEKDLIKLNPEVINKIKGYINELNRRINFSFLKNIDSEFLNSGVSFVFSMASGYRELYKYHLMLQHGLNITGDVFNIKLKNLATLYEYWCFIKLSSLLKRRYKLVSQNVIKVDKTGVSLRLIKGNKSRIKYINPINNEVFELVYNPTYYREENRINRSETVGQKPDNVLRITKKSFDNCSENVYEYVFDAKYRIDPAAEGSSYQSKYKTPGPVEDSINTMHRYRDAIVCSYEKDSSYNRLMFGGYVLFPYSNIEEYKEHVFYKSIAKVNIGGLPFLPDSTELVEERLEELITDSSDSAFENVPLQNGLKEKLEKVNWDIRNVLVSPFRSVNNYDICKSKNFYYTPKKNISIDKNPIHYIALSRSKNLWGDKAGIDEYGEVVYCWTCKRSEITEFPDYSGDPNEEYVCFKVKNWQKLGNNKVIRPKGEGVSRPFLTNLFLLNNSSVVGQLHIKSDVAWRLWSELTRVYMAHIDDDSDNNEPIIRLNNTLVSLELDGIHVKNNGIDVECIDIRSFYSRPSYCVKRIMNFVANH